MSKKYHQQHPTISFRCQNIDEYNEIKKMVKSSGKSESTFIREILLNAQVKESQSFNSGYNSAFNKFGISCNICGQTIIIDLNKDQEAIKRVNKNICPIVHTTCIENQKRQQEAEQQQKFNRTYNW